MRTLFFSLLFLPSLLLAASSSPQFNPATVQTFKGEISSVQTFGYVTRPTPHKQILLRTVNGEVTVDVGPDWYLDLQGITLFPGEEIEVVGSLTQVNGTYYVIASTVTIHGTTYTLRDLKGRSVWKES